MMYQGAWECKMCMIKNIPERMKCVACGLLREVEELIPGRNFESAANFTKTSGQWSCFACKKSNAKNKTRCEVCEAPKLNVLESDSPSYKTQLKEWQCSVCAEKHNTLSKCSICKCDKPSDMRTPIENKSSQRSPKWECNCCRLMNDDNKTECVDCKRPKPRSSFAKMCYPGDWKCSNCLVWNPRMRQKCSCCESQKPEESGYDTTNIFCDDDLDFGINPDLAHYNERSKK